MLGIERQSKLIGSQPHAFQKYVSVIQEIKVTSHCGTAKRLSWVTKLQMTQAWQLS